MGLQHSYALIAPFYDAALAAATRGARRQSLGALPQPPSDVLLLGIGTGLDIPHLPRQHRYTGLDLTPAMLARACRRSGGLDFAPVRGDARRLPFADASFDAVVLHLILAVVPEPRLCLQETARVLRPGGTALIFDKFLQPGQRAPLRRLLSPLVSRLATHLDVVFETVHESEAALQLESDRPALAAGWFRLIRLRRR
ncbi:class I SAM-dependent methyltransferase [Azospira sp. APE16]|uniref:class I SAM-dependent methyltransferase n=1 Tax=Azospira sp. APE16 TaxID=3394231 RepID=UPI003A4DCBC7